MKRLQHWLRFENKLILFQLGLIFPLVILVLTTTAFGIRNSVKKDLIKSKQYTLDYTASQLDLLFETCIKLLEKPYSNKSIYDILNKDYSTLSPYKALEETNIDTKKISSFLYNDILYYNNFIASVTLVPVNKATSYTKCTYPSFSNVSLKGSNLQLSDWYLKAINTDDVVITGAYEDTLYSHNNSLIISFSQRLKNVFENKLLGVMRIDIRISDLIESWKNLISDSLDILIVFDNMNQVVYSSNPELNIDLSSLSSYDINEIHTLDLPNYSSIYAKAPLSNFTFLYLSSIQKTNTQFYVLFTSATTGLIIYFFIALAFILFNSTYLGKPITKLKTAMTQVQSKDLSIRCEPLYGDMRQLSDSFNTLMETINQLVDEVKVNESEKAKLSYEVLQSQISPHFLYNTLNAIKWKADTLGAKDIAKTLDSLVLLLKFTIKCKDDLVPLEIELEQLEHYIQIMRLRYGNSIEINFDIDEECFNYQSMKFLIQPIIENCFLHAFDDKCEEKYINISIQNKDDYIVYEIYDNGKGICPETINSMLNGSSTNKSTLFVSIGINNVNQRIKSLFGSNYGILIQSELTQYTLVTITLPKLPKEEYAYENITC